MPEPYGCCYWRSSELSPPSLVEAYDKLEKLKAEGSSKGAFHFREVLKPEYSDPNSFAPEDVVGM